MGREGAPSGRRGGGAYSRVPLYRLTKKILKNLGTGHLPPSEKCPKVPWILSVIATVWTDGHKGQVILGQFFYFIYMHLYYIYLYIYIYICPICPNNNKYSNSKGFIYGHFGH